MNYFNRNAIIISLLAFGFLLTIWRTAALVFRESGHYQQSDWLINYSGGVVRRGIGGEAIFFISDLIGINPLIIVGVAVSTLTTMIFGLVLIHISRIEISDILMLTLLSPAFLLFWANDFGGAHRKEIVAFAAFLPLISSAKSIRALSFQRTISVLIFGISVALHEANAFLAPMLVAAMIVSFPGQKIANAASSAAVYALAIAGVVFALKFSAIEDYEPLCARVLAYGLNEHLCDGIFPLLDDGMDRGVGMSRELLGRTSFSVAFFLVVLCVSPVVALLASLRFSKLEYTAITLGVLAILPLFVVAVDWGRWVAFATFGMTFVGLIRASQSTALRRSNELPRGLRTVAIVLILGVGIGHFGLKPVPGFVFVVANTLASKAP